MSLRVSPRVERLLLLVPAGIIILVFGVALADLLSWSLRSGGKLGAAPPPGVGLQTYARVLADPLYLSAVATTLRLSAIATLFSLLLGLPVAFWIVRTSSGRARTALIMLVSIPFMTSLIVRLYSLTLLLGNNGLINRGLQSFGALDENDFVPLIRNETSVAIGLVYFVLPFVVFTLVGNFRRFDRTLEEAAQNLGADELTTLLRVTLPLMAPGIAAAATLAFVLAGTAFATPLILGGSNVRMIANVIYDQALFAQNMPVAATLSALALVLTVACLWIARVASAWRIGRA